MCKGKTKGSDTELALGMPGGVSDPSGNFHQWGNDIILAQEGRIVM